jgi:hypothetical protein
MHCRRVQQLMRLQLSIHHHMRACALLTLTFKVACAVDRRQKLSVLNPPRSARQLRTCAASWYCPGRTSPAAEQASVTLPDASVARSSHLNAGLAGRMVENRTSLPRTGALFWSSTVMEKACRSVLLCVASAVGGWMVIF